MWSNGTATAVGAVTWCSGTVGCTGVVSTTNSLVGSTASDLVGGGGNSKGVTALTNGNYVVSSPQWTNDTMVHVGAVTWCSGTTGCTGVVSTTNSMVGSTANDQVGYVGVTALVNGNYVIGSLYWTNGAATQAGAATWCSGTTECTGVVSITNSLVGSTVNDQVSFYGITSLPNGDYVVNSPLWTNGADAQVGAVTQCSGTVGCTGAVSASNSLVGGTVLDRIGSPEVTALTNGNYVVASRSWSNGAVTGAGAATWCSRTSGCTGAVSAGNSLVGSTANDQVGDKIGHNGVTALSNRVLC